MAWPHPDRPYNDLPPIPRSGLESRPVLKACVSARAALAGLDQAAQLLPNPAVLLNTLPILEAQASTEIEHIVTTADALFKYADVEGAADPATREGLRYQAALMEGFRSLDERPLDTATAEAVCSRIKGKDMSIRRVPGTALQNVDTGRVIYTPPEGADRLRSMLADWERFLHEARDIEPLVRLAAGHYQFEAIHPFTDGNGRTGRVLNSLFLVSEGLLTLPILYLSRFIIQHRTEYYARLLDVTTAEAWEPWLIFVLEGIAETSIWTRDKIAEVRSLMERTAADVRREAPKVYSHELIGVIFSQPYVRIRNLVEAEVVERQAASRYLKALVQMGVLEEFIVGREKLFLNTGLMRVLTTDHQE